MASNLLDPANCACFNIRRAARKITQAYDRALRPASLTATQFSLLAMLRDGDDGGGVPLGALATRLGMDRTTLTRNLAPAARAGWVRVAAGEDRRERRISLTSAGRQKIEMAMPFWTTAQERALERLGRSRLTALLSLSHRLDEI